MSYPKDYGPEYDQQRGEHDRRESDKERFAVPETQVRRITESDQPHEPTERPDTTMPILQDPPDGLYGEAQPTVPTEIPGATPSPAPSDTLREAAERAAKAVYSTAVHHYQTVSRFDLERDDHEEAYNSVITVLQSDILAAVAPIVAEGEAGLNEAVKKYLSEPHCCNGQDCACGGASRLDFFVYEEAGAKISQLRATVARLTAELAEARKDAERLDWLQLRMYHDADYCEIYLAGLRNWNEGATAHAFQVESSPQKFPLAQGETLRAAIDAAKEAT